MTASSQPIRRLLVLACSATKRPDVGHIPARLRYDGPLWRTLRSVDPNHVCASVAFLSARYGFRDAETPIAHYDARLTQDLAERMIAGGMTTRWPRPRRRNGADNAGMHPGAEIASMARYGHAPPFDGVALVGGGLYLTVMHAMLEGFQRMECVHSDARVTTINGPIRPHAAGPSQVAARGRPSGRRHAMMSHPEACTALTRMEASLRDTRHNLYELARSLRDRAETETIDSRPKARRYDRRMSNWTGKDEEAYLHVLDRLTDNAAADLDRLRRKIERQDAAIEALRKKYRVNAERPVFMPL